MKSYQTLKTVLYITRLTKLRFRKLFKCKFNQRVCHTEWCDYEQQLFKKASLFWTLNYKRFNINMVMNINIIIILIRTIIQIKRFNFVFKTQEVKKGMHLGVMNWNNSFIQDWMFINSKNTMKLEENVLINKSTIHYISLIVRYWHLKKYRSRNNEMKFWFSILSIQDAICDKAIIIVE